MYKSSKRLPYQVPGNGHKFIGLVQVPAKDYLYRQRPVCRFHGENQYRTSTEI